MDFLDIWKLSLQSLAGLFFAIALLNRGVFWIKTILLNKNRVKKYDYVLNHDEKNLKRTSIFLSYTIFFLMLLMVSGWFSMKEVYEYISTFMIAILVSYLTGYVLTVIIEYKYTNVVERKLRNIRFKPLYSKKSNAKMKLLNELEEDEHLTDEMKEKEEALVADFDVWIDTTSGDKVIFEYDIIGLKLICPNCNFRTLIEKEEKVTKESTELEDGQMERFYTCSYCEHREIKHIRIPNWREKRDIEGISVR